MRIVLVGADFEENLGVGMVAAVAARAGHDVHVVPFNVPEDSVRVAERVLAHEPDIVGLSIQFQHRAAEFLGLARTLRARGFAGHVTAGGQFPTLAWRDAIADARGLDSIVLHEGEESFVELLDAIALGRRLPDVPGLALRADDGAPMRTAGRRLEDDLDRHPFPTRYRPHGTHFGVPFVPILGGRGCWGSCKYCSITSTLRDARAHGGAKMLRHRSPANVASEMVALSRAAGDRAIFCFHDDNFLMPRPADSLERVRAIRAAYDALGGGEVALIGKCRPDSVTPELMRAIRKLGVIRLYVGVENASQRGADHLGRRAQQACVADALEACRLAGIFVCYNLLLFEPDATLDDVRENVAFMKHNAQHPVNFCRAEPYVGTPLHADVAARQELGGSFLGFNYRIQNDDTELLFRICSAAFRQRNFDPEGVANRNMGLGYSLKILEQFYDDRDGARADLARRTERLTRAITMETASFLGDAITIVERYRGVDDAIARQTALLGLDIASADRARHAQLDELYLDMNRSAQRATSQRWWTIPKKRLAHVAQSVALSATLAVGAGACDACSGPQDDTNGREHLSPVVDPPPPDPVPYDPMPGDPPPPDPLPADPIEPMPPVDPPPYDWQREAPLPPDPPPPDWQRAPPLAPVDPPPPDRPETDRRRNDNERRPTPPRLVPPDPLPRDYRPPIVDPVPAPRPKGTSLELVDQWRETSVKDVMRTTDLPLFDPPRARLRATWSGDAVEVELEGVPAQVSLRWAADGRVIGEGTKVRWVPSSSADQLRVAVRSAGGVAVTSVRASQVR